MKLVYHLQLVAFQKTDTGLFRCDGKKFSKEPTSGVERKSGSHAMSKKDEASSR